MLVDLNNLKGMDFSKKYFNPTKECHIINENYEFHVKPRVYDGLIVDSVQEFKFNNKTKHSTGFFPHTFLKSQLASMELDKNKILAIEELFQDSKFDVEKLYDELTINLEFNILRAILLKNGIKTKNKILLNKRFFWRFLHENDDENINIVRKRLSKYVNVKNADVENLIQDLCCYWHYPKYKIHYKYLACKIILEDFNLNDDKLDDFFTIIQSKMVFNHDYLDYVKKEDFDENAPISFKLAYIGYLSLINSYHDNSMDSKHYFDEGQLPEDSYFKESNEYFYVDSLKKSALLKNHIIEGRGIGVLKFKSKVVDIKEVLEKYGLKKSGNKSELIDRILSNLSPEEINKEFHGSRFILTEEGKELLDKYDYYASNYLRRIPHNFDVEEIISLYELNPDYGISDILFALSINDWVLIENPLLFDNNTLSSLKNEINMQRYWLADDLKNNYPEKAVELYLKGIHSELTSYPAKQLCDLYHKQNDYDGESKLLVYLIEQMDFEIDLDSLKGYNENRIIQEIGLIRKLINNIKLDNKFDKELFNLNRLENIILEFNNVKNMESEDYYKLRIQYLDFRNELLEKS